MNLNDFGAPSAYLSKADVPEKGFMLTIKSISKVRVGRGASAEDKIALTFVEKVKPMICNKTNANRIAQFTGVTHNVEQGWIGVKIVVYFDPNVEFGGDIVGGLRIRAPRLPPGQPSQRPAVQQPQPRTAAPATCPRGDAWEGPTEEPIPQDSGPPSEFYKEQQGPYEGGY